MLEKYVHTHNFWKFHLIVKFELSRLKEVYCWFGSKHYFASWKKLHGHGFDALVTCDIPKLRLKLHVRNKNKKIIWKRQNRTSHSIIIIITIFIIDTKRIIMLHISVTLIIVKITKREEEKIKLTSSYNLSRMMLRWIPNSIDLKSPQCHSNSRVVCMYHLQPD